MPKRLTVLCHDCRAVLGADDRAHYSYQCHSCVVIEHERLRIARTDPGHPEAEHLSRSAVHLDWAGGTGERRRPVTRSRPSSA